MNSITEQRPVFDTADMDRRIGERIRRRRSLLGLTQDQLGEAIKISYQQVQKYETGANRVSASRLQQIAHVLEAPISWFYGDVEADDTKIADAPSSRHVIELVRAFSAIESEKIRMGVLSLAKTLASYQGKDKESAENATNGSADAARASLN